MTAEQRPRVANPTPGPWAVVSNSANSSPFAIATADGYRLGYALYGPTGGVAEAEANARLIAAAPQFADAARSAILEIDAACHAMPSDPESIERDLHVYEALERAQQALYDALDAAGVSPNDRSLAEARGT